MQRSSETIGAIAAALAKAQAELAAGRYARATSKSGRAPSALSRARPSMFFVSLAGQSVRAFCRPFPSLERGRGENGRQGGALDLRRTARVLRRRARSPTRDPQRRAIAICGLNQGRACFSRPIFCAFAPFGLTARTTADARAIGLRKQKIGRWRQAAARDPS